MWCLLPSCGICFSFLQRILPHQNFAGVRNLHCDRHLTTPSARLCLFGDDLDMAVGAYALLICLCCDKDNTSKRLELLLFHNHFNITLTRRVLCLTLHPHPRDLPAQHSQRPRTRL